MPGMVHLVLQSMATEWYGPQETKRHMPRYFGFAEATNGSPAPDDDSWISAVGRRISAIVAASVAVLLRF